MRARRARATRARCAREVRKVRARGARAARARCTRELTRAPCSRTSRARLSLLARLARACLKCSRARAAHPAAGEAPYMNPYVLNQAKLSINLSNYVAPPFILYIAPSHQFFKSVLWFFRFWYMQMLLFFEDCIVVFQATTQLPKKIDVSNTSLH